MKQLIVLSVSVLLTGCMLPGELQRPELPSLAYTRHLGGDSPTGKIAVGDRPQIQRLSETPQGASPRASLHLVKDYPQDEYPEVDTLEDDRMYEETPRAQMAQQDFSQKATGRKYPDVVSNMNEPPIHLQEPRVRGESFQVSRNANPHVRPYQGPLAVGEPGAGASLWRAQGTGSSLFRDHRAFQPMDLITIVVSENAEGSKEADSETSKESSFLAGISKLFNFTDNIIASNPGLDPTTLVDADFSSEFTGEGETVRRGSLQARISAVVAEVLPNGVMRIEGEKIISVNNEEQMMIISGLVRPRDVSSANEVMSAKIAYLRVDYFGKGLVGDAQYSGWLGRALTKIWPF